MEENRATDPRIRPEESQLADNGAVTNDSIVRPPWNMLQALAYVLRRRIMLMSHEEASAAVSKTNAEPFDKSRYVYPSMEITYRLRKIDSQPITQYGLVQLVQLYLARVEDGETRVRNKLKQGHVNAIEIAAAMIYVHCVEGNLPIPGIAAQADAINGKSGAVILKSDATPLRITSPIETEAVLTRPANNKSDLLNATSEHAKWKLEEAVAFYIMRDELRYGINRIKQVIPYDYSMDKSLAEHKYPATTLDYQGKQISSKASIPPEVRARITKYMGKYYDAAKRLEEILEQPKNYPALAAMIYGETEVVPKKVEINTGSAKGRAVNPNAKKDIVLAKRPNDHMTTGIPVIDVPLSKGARKRARKAARLAAELEAQKASQEITRDQLAGLQVPTTSGDVSTRTQLASNSADDRSSESRPTTAESRPNTADKSLKKGPVRTLDQWSVLDAITFNVLQYELKVPGVTIAKALRTPLERMEGLMDSSAYELRSLHWPLTSYEYKGVSYTAQPLTSGGINTLIKAFFKTQGAERRVQSVYNQEGIGSIEVASMIYHETFPGMQNLVVKNPKLADPPALKPAAIQSSAQHARPAESMNKAQKRPHEAEAAPIPQQGSSITAAHKVRNWAHLNNIQKRSRVEPAPNVDHLNLIAPRRKSSSSEMPKGSSAMATKPPSLTNDDARAVSSSTQTTGRLGIPSLPRPGSGNSRQALTWQEVATPAKISTNGKAPMQQVSAVSRQEHANQLPMSVYPSTINSAKLAPSRGPSDSQATQSPTVPNGVQSLLGETRTQRESSPINLDSPAASDNDSDVIMLDGPPLESASKHTKSLFSFSSPEAELPEVSKVTKPTSDVKVSIGPNTVQPFVLDESGGEDSESEALDDAKKQDPAARTSSTAFVEPAAASQMQPHAKSEVSPLFRRDSTSLHDFEPSQPFSNPKNETLAQNPTTGPTASPKAVQDNLATSLFGAETPQPPSKSSAGISVRPSLGVSEVPSPRSKPDTASSTASVIPPRTHEPAAPVKSLPIDNSTIKPVSSLIEHHSEDLVSSDEDNRRSVTPDHPLNQSSDEDMEDVSAEPLTFPVFAQQVTQTFSETMTTSPQLLTEQQLIGLTKIFNVPERSLHRRLIEKFIYLKVPPLPQNVPVDEERTTTRCLDILLSSIAAQPSMKQFGIAIITQYLDIMRGSQDYVAYLIDHDSEGYDLVMRYLQLL